MVATYAKLSENVSTEAMPEMRDACTETVDNVHKISKLKDTTESESRIKGQVEMMTEMKNKREQYQQTDCQQQQAFVGVMDGGKVDEMTLDKDLVPISASELSRLEQDMKSLRDAVRAKEELWDQALERERNYREHLARLSVELITVRQLSESRHDELQNLAQKLTDGKEELRATQKDLTLAKKTIAKMQQRLRNVDEQSSIGIGKQPQVEVRPESSNSISNRSPRQKLSKPSMQVRRDNRSSRILGSGDAGNTSGNNTSTKEASKV
ncbi:hypothetical protein QAD02_023301 [Eretmocerus hayati]|uniref:Uncharacterized protein n=1 Tax=Eretmocerus hayati TaxID=131215 RepID=A0ACC2PYT3_9HYME|nr:hypothetical protein QAD02_023301 [Eretmocerus hayati]